MSEIRSKVARSSLGTPSAVAARRSVTKAQAGKVVARSAALRGTPPTVTKKGGGNADPTPYRRTSSCNDNGWARRHGTTHPGATTLVSTDQCT